VEHLARVARVSQRTLALKGACRFEERALRIVLTRCGGARVSEHQARRASPTRTALALECGCSTHARPSVLAGGSAKAKVRLLSASGAKEACFAHTDESVNLINAGRVVLAKIGGAVVRVNGTGVSFVARRAGAGR
jgi:hypothetical protein